MKQALTVFIIIMLLVLGFVGVSTVSTKNVRQNELDTSLADSMQSAMEASKVDVTTSYTNDELVADVMEGVVSNINSDSHCSFKVYSVDAEKGYLDMEVEETFGQLFGTGKVSSRRQVIFDEWEDKTNTMYTVKFKDGTEVVKTVECKYKQNMTAKMLPQSVDPKIKGWKLKSNGQTYTSANIGNIQVISDLEFTAVR